MHSKPWADFHAAVGLRGALSSRAGFRTACGLRRALSSQADFCAAVGLRGSKLMAWLLLWGLFVWAHHSRGGGEHLGSMTLWRPRIPSDLTIFSISSSRTSAINLVVWLGLLDCARTAINFTILLTVDIQVQSLYSCVDRTSYIWCMHGIRIRGAHIQIIIIGVKRVLSFLEFFCINGLRIKIFFYFDLGQF